MGNKHNHSSDGKLTIAIVINVMLTVAQVLGGVVSGSLSLIADALHNLSDAGALVVAIVAQRIGNRSSSASMTYGYKRAEIIGVVINSTSLIVVGLYLIYEAANKFLNPAEVDGWIVIWVAGIALVVDVATAILTYRSGAKENMNIRAAFIHNVSDAAASLVVVIAGLLIIYFQLYIFDAIATICISVYVVYHGCILLKKSILIIMQAVPENISIEDIQKALEELDGVESSSHIHIWQLDDQKIFMEVHLILSQADSESIKRLARKILKDEYGIGHTTIETVVTKQ